MAARRKKVMTRAYRIFLNDANKTKVKTLANLAIKCRDITQYFVDFFWQCQYFTGKLANLPTVHLKTIVVEDLKKVKSGTRGTFSRRFNRRLSHWLYKYSETLMARKCEELGIEVIRKNPGKTSQFCRYCFKWDRRNCRGDKFLCVNCHHGVEHADFNASKNLELLGLLGFYGIHDLQNSKCQSFE